MTFKPDDPAASDLLNPTPLPSPPLPCACLVSRRSRVRIPLKPWCFQGSSFQLLKFENLLRWSLFTSQFLPLIEESHNFVLRGNSTYNLRQTFTKLLGTLEYQALTKCKLNMKIPVPLRCFPPSLPLPFQIVIWLCTAYANDEGYTSGLL